MLTSFIFFPNWAKIYQPSSSIQNLHSSKKKLSSTPKFTIQTTTKFHQTSPNFHPSLLLPFATNKSTKNPKKRKLVLHLEIFRFEIPIDLKTSLWNWWYFWSSHSKEINWWKFRRQSSSKNFSGKFDQVKVNKKSTFKLRFKSVLISLIYCITLILIS